MAGKKVLVTGGAGFIGSYVVDRLVEVGCDVAVNHEGDAAYGSADAFVPAANNGGAAGEAFDIAGGNPAGMRGLAEMMVGVRGVDGWGVLWCVMPGKGGRGDVVEMVADLSKIAMLGFEPKKIRLEDGILKLKEWFGGRCK